MLVKIDIHSAFRLLSVHPEDRHLLTMSWKGEVYIDHCIPFGLRSTPKFTPQLFTAAQSYLDRWMSAATKKAYETGLNKYLAFCIQCKQQTIPASENTLVLFVTHLTNQQLSHATIQVYLSAVH